MTQIPEERLPCVESATLDAFATLAADYCRLVEGHKSLERTDFLRPVLMLLPRLYSAGLALPDVGILFPDTGAAPEVPEQTGLPGAEEAPDPDRGDHEEWSRLFLSLGALLGDRDQYREVFDPFEPVTEAEVMGSLADDLGDIYRDLRAGLRKWRRGETGDALWEWRFGFESHWGEHLTGALRAVHVLSSTYDLGWPPTEGAA